MTPKVVGEPTAPTDPGTEKLIADLEELVDAQKVANAAEPITVINPETGKPVKHLHMRLSARDTKRVMSLPPHQRAAMAESILAERAIIKYQKRALEAKRTAGRGTRVARRKAAAKSRRRNRA